MEQEKQQRSCSRRTGGEETMEKQLKKQHLEQEQMHESERSRKNNNKRMSA